VPTDAGDVWFKAAVPGLDHDAGVTAVLGRLRPDAVLAPLALDLERGWMILPDGGERLREVLDREQHPRRWLEIMPLYAELQIAAAPAVDELLAAGLPDYRLARMPELALDTASRLGVEAPPVENIEALLDELAAIGIPETVQHDDLHDGNVFVRADGAYAVFDWGDGCAAHPFASLVVGLRGIAHRFELAPGDPDLERARDAYLEPWDEFAPPAELRRAVELTEAVGRLSRSLAWFRSLPEGDAESEERESARYWFEEFSRAVLELAR
jgi:aminoglycoside phosphotransferase (APT) family kinase protein